MLEVWAAVLLSLVSGVSGGLGGWLFGRKRQNIDNIDAATTTFNNIIKSLEHKINMLLEQQQSDTKRIAEMSQEIESLRQEIENLKADKKENRKLKKQILNYEKLLEENNIVY